MLDRWRTSRPGTRPPGTCLTSRLNDDLITACLPPTPGRGAAPAAARADSDGLADDDGGATTINRKRAVFHSVLEPSLVPRSTGSGPTPATPTRNAASSTAPTTTGARYPSRPSWSRSPAHIKEHGGGPDGRSFRSEHGKPVASTAYTEVWQDARPLAFTPEQAASPLAGRPYDLRHAAVSLWLNGGVSPTEIAKRAGHSVEVLLRVYAKCVSGQEEIANHRIEEILGGSDHNDTMDDLAA
jgi:hypothetical protein